MSRMLSHRRFALSQLPGMLLLAGLCGAANLSVDARSRARTRLLLVRSAVRVDEERYDDHDRVTSVTDLLTLTEPEIAEAGIGRKFQKPTVFESQTIQDNLLLALNVDHSVRGTLFWRESPAETATIDRAPSVAAAEVAIGLALIVAIFRHKKSINIDDLHQMEG